MDQFTPFDNNAMDFDKECPDEYCGEFGSCRRDAILGFVCECDEGYALPKCQTQADADSANNIAQAISE